MTRLTKPALVLIALILLTFAPSVSAVTAVVGNNNDLSRYPFGSDPGSASSQFPDFTAGGIYQQVYVGAFTGPVTITQIAFASKGQLTSGPGTAIYNFNIGLSTTGASPATLSTNLAANRGGDFTQVFSGQVTAQLTANNQFDLLIDITPFTYNPASGNLLLEVVMNSPRQFSGGSVLYFVAGNSSDVGRAANPTGAAGGAFTSNGFGVQTRFTTRSTAQVTLDNLAQTFDGSPKSVVVNTDPAGLNVDVTYNGSTTAPANAGSYAVTATVNDSNFSGQASGSLVIGKADQLIAFGPLLNRTLGEPDFIVSATASSNLAVAFSAIGNCTLNGSQVHLTGAGSCTITASQDGDANINAAVPVARAFSIGRADQQITFAALPNRTFGDADFAVSATASSNLTVSFAASGKCTMAGSQVHLTGAGACTITASQDGDANVNAAAQIARTFSIAKADQQITFDALPNRTFGEADFAVSATASSNLGVSFAATGNCTVAGTQVHLTAAGACTINASQDGDTNVNAAVPVGRSFSIGKADQQITFAPLADKNFGDPNFDVVASASSGLPVSFAAGGNCAVSGTEVHVTVVGTCTITASQEGDANHNPAAQVARTFSIAKSDQQITFAALADRKFGDPDFRISATANSNLEVSFTASGNCTLTGVDHYTVHLTGAGSCTITASQEGNANSNAAVSVVRTFSISKADQQITFAPLAAKKFGDADFGISATASSNLVVSFGASGKCTLSGSQVQLSGAGSCTITASQAGDDNNNAAPQVARTFSITKADQQITLGVLADKKFGDADFGVSATASSNLAVSFTAGGNCTVSGTQVHIKGAGVCTITASQDGDANTNAAALVARTFTIIKVDQQITFATLADRKFGDADFGISATASSTLAVSFTTAGNCTLAGNQVHLSGAGACTITASQDGDGNNNAAAPVARTFSIARADQRITFAALVDKKLGDADFGVSATASSNLTISFAATGNCTLSGTQVHLTASGSCTITASQDGNSDYNQAEAVARTFAIADQPANQTLFSFSEPAYETSESAGTIRITVERSGDTSGPATVDYATDDDGLRARCDLAGTGRASSRCDFTAVFGTLRFAANQTRKTFDIPINEDSFAEGPETFKINLSNPTGRGAGLASTANSTVTIDESTAPAPNAIDDTETLVRQQYRDFLNRDADPDGLAFWKNNIDKCNDPAQRQPRQTLAQCVELQRIVTSAAFFLSIEFRGTGGLVRDFYVAALDRPATNNMPNFAEFQRDTQAAQTGLIVGQGNWEQVLHQNRIAFMNDFVTRAEFVGLYPETDTPAQYVDKLYQHAGITPSDNERTNAIAEFGGAANAADPGARGRALADITQNSGFQQRELNRGFVQMEYFGYLRRNPNDAPDGNFAGYDFWLNKLNAFSGNFIDAEMVKAFLSSIEYRQRFGP